MAKGNAEACQSKPRTRAGMTRGGGFGHESVRPPSLPGSTTLALVPSVAGRGTMALSSAPADATTELWPLHGA